MLLGLGVVLVGLLVLCVVHWIWDNNRPGMPPGPKGWPIVFTLPEIIKNRDRIYDFLFLDRCMKYGTVWSGRVSILNPRGVIVVDPACAEWILKDNWTNYVKGQFWIDLLEPLLGHGIFNANGNQWKQQRQTASHMFAIKEIKGFAEIFAKHGQELVQLLQEKQRSGETADMQDLFSKCTLDSIGRIAFGTEIGSLHHDVEFAKAFNTAQLCLDERGFNPLWKITPFVKSEITLRNCVKVLDEFAYKLIADRRKDPMVHTYNDLLSRYIMLKDDDGKPFSDLYLRDIIMSFLIAGRDTTAQTLTWCFYLLSQNPREEQLLIDEINNTLNGATPTYENTKSMKYLQAVIDETLRLYPPVPIDPKVALEDDTLPNGMKVYKGWTVEWHAWAMGRHPDFWDEPLVFKPERWLGANPGSKAVPMGNKPPFIPFQYGPRTCLGINFAYLEVKVVLCTILQNLRLRLAQESVHYRSAITITVKGGIKMTPVPL